jgi:hypothetical protein
MIRPLLVENVKLQLERWSEAAYPFETGGVLLGITSEDRPWVVMAAQVPSAAPARFSYMLPAGATHFAVEKGRAVDPRVGYLGDWHSHPMDARASLTDLATYGEAFKGAVRRREEAPLMVVVRCSDEGWETDLLARSGLFRPAMPVPFTLTGPPPAS